MTHRFSLCRGISLYENGTVRRILAEFVSPFLSLYYRASYIHYDYLLAEQANRKISVMNYKHESRPSIIDAYIMSEILKARADSLNKYTNTKISSKQRRIQFYQHLYNPCL